MCAPGGFDSTIAKWRSAGVWPEADPLIALPRGGYRAIAYDRRESGESGGRFEPLSWDLYALEIDQLRDHLGLPAIWLLGGCMGCSTAFSYAVRYPHHVAGLLLHWPIGGAGFYQHARGTWMSNAIGQAREKGMVGVVEAAAKSGSMMGDVRAGPWASLIARDQAFATTMRSLSVDEYVAVLEQTRDSLFPDTFEAPGATPEQLQQLNVPVFIAPGDDPFHATSAADYLAEQLPQAELWIPTSQQGGATLMAALLQFLEDHS
jgi:pimeloyl-ACP methyl ester carboxylesterase